MVIEILRGLFPGMNGGEPMDMSDDQRFQSLQQRFQMNRGQMMPQEEQNLPNSHSDEDDVGSLCTKLLS